MNVLCELNDALLFGEPGLSDIPPRLAARAILQNNEGKFALMYLAKFGLYSLPGGGMEAGEEIIPALRREILEETGCSCDEIRELGIVLENRGCHDFTQHNYYYFVKTRHKGNAHLTDKEKANGAQLQWHSFPEFCRLIRESRYETKQQKYIQARDVAALEAYCKD